MRKVVFMNPNPKKGKMTKEGSVLFTVVTVMMVMVVFLMSTLTLTTSANRRSFYTYFQTQAQYTAQAGLDAVTNAAYSNGEFAEWVGTLTTVGQKGDITLNYNSTNMPLSEGVPVLCNVERVEPIYIWDNDASRILKRDAWKITVTATVGTGRNAATYSTCNYIYSNDNSDMEVATAENKAEWSNVDSIHEEITPGKREVIQNPQKMAMNNAVLSFSALKADGGAANNIFCLGPQTANIDTFPAGKGNYAGEFVNTLKNDNANVGNVTIIGNTQSNTHAMTVFQKGGEGYAIYGDFKNLNDTYFYNEIRDPVTDYKDIPYIYVDGTFIQGNQPLTIGDSPYASTNGLPVNMYLNSIDLGHQNAAMNNFNLTGDMYLFDPEAESTFIQNGAGAYLGTFAYNNINKANYTKDGCFTGNLICNNKKLTIANVELDGDLIMTNPASELVVTGNLKVGGTILCAGKITGSGGAIQAGGGLYVTKSKATGLDGNASDLAAFCDNSGGYSEVDGTVIKNTSTSAKIYSLNLSQTGSNYDDLVKKILATVTTGYNNEKAKYLESPEFGMTSYDFRLFPFCYRQDEIFESYIRWDLQFATAEEATRAINTDPGILESRACGHTWGPVQKVSASGTVFVPATTPIGGEKSANSFIPELKTVDPANIADFHYDNSFNDFASGLDTKTGFNTPTGTVRFPSYDKTGKKSDITINNCYIIQEDCIIDLAKFGKDLTEDIPGGGLRRIAKSDNNNTVTIFIDPYQKDLVKNGAMKIAFMGSVSSTNIRVIVNNNANYTMKDAGNNVDFEQYAEKPNDGYAGRADCLLFFNGDVNVQGGDSYFGTTGAYQQVLADHDLDVVSNPIYPNDAKWSALGADEKYKYQLVPNLIIYGQKDATIKFEKIPFLNAAVIMPDSTIATQASTTDKDKFYVYYREDLSCDRFDMRAHLSNDHNKMLDLNTLGSLYVGEFQAQNLPTTIYIGDTNRPGEVINEEPESNFTRNSTSDDSSQNRRVTKDRDYLENDHQGAG